VSHPLPTATQLAVLVVEALGVAGVTHVVLCPGSRSAPLAYAVDASPLSLLVRIDERVAGFTAVGIGRAGGLAAVVTTSGTAVANLHPAVLEAHHAGVPLVVVSADRPPALRGTWASQTSELQAHLFGDALRSLLDLDDVAAAADPSGARQALRTAIAAAQGGGGRPGGGRPGPVQLNLGFSDPLLPPAGPAVGGAATPADRAEPDRAEPDRAEPDTAEPDRLPLARGPRTVIVAGDGSPADGGRALALAAATGWPLLAEPTSHARGGPQAVGPYRLLLPHPDLGGAVERVVVTGRPTLSRPVNRLLGDGRVELVLVSDHADWPEPGRAVVRARRVGLDPQASAQGQADDSRWGELWRRADVAARRALDQVLAAAQGLNGPVLAREVAAVLRPGQLLVAGSSNPVRDLDLAAHPHPERPLPAFANRGLAGIDGTVATATGMALARPGRGAGRGRGPVRVLLGDLAFLHDVGALLADPGALADARAQGLAEAARPWLQIVVLDDGGGGIFSLLEYGRLATDSGAGDPAAAATRFERLFGTPHQVDLAAVCAGYGVPLRRADDLASLRAALADPPPGTSVVAVPADRAGLRGLHAAIRTAVGEALSW
jgi:2-succinyl-5-enolpyruvyl-6-hydroxy-3-cyclohexene-1-carboxylate synthase